MVFTVGLPKIGGLILSISFSPRNTVRRHKESEQNKISRVMSRHSMGDTADQLVVTCVCIAMAIFYSFDAWYNVCRGKIVLSSVQQQNIVSSFIKTIFLFWVEYYFIR